MFSVPLLFGQDAIEGSSAALVTFGLYSLAVFVIAWLSHKVLLKRKFMSEYFLGSRNLGLIAFTLTFGATSASAGSFAGFPALIYTHGWVLAIWISGYTVAVIVAMGLFGKRINQIARKTGAITVPDMLRERFQSPAVSMLATLMIVTTVSVYLIPQFKIASLILVQLLEGNIVLVSSAAMMDSLTKDIGLLASVESEYFVCLLFFAVLVIAYTTFGGFRAVVWTDVMQGIVMFFGVLIMLVLALWQVGGLNKATEKMALMIPPKIGQAVFVIEEPAAEDLRISDNAWFTLPDENSDHVRLFRANKTALIAEGTTESKAVAIVEIITPEEIEDILASFPAGKPKPLLNVPVDFRLYKDKVDVTAEDAEESNELTSYAYGAGKRNTYISPPGPDLTDGAGFLPMIAGMSFFLFFALNGPGQPATMVRLMAFDKSKTVRGGIAMLSIYFAMIYFPLVIIFCCARVLIPGADANADRIMPLMSFHLSQTAGVPWLAGFLVAAPFAAAMSTVDSFMLMISSSIVRDVYQKSIKPNATQREVKWLSYGCMLVIGTIVTVLSINPPNVIQHVVVFASGGLAAVFTVPTILAMYWRRFNTPGMLCGMLGGLAPFTVLYSIKWINDLYEVPLIKDYSVSLFGFHPMFWGFIGSGVVAYLVTMNTDPPPEKLVSKFFDAEEIEAEN